MLAAALALFALSSSLILPAAASADGDPASDVLAGQLAFLPADAGLTTHQLQELSGLLSEASRDGLSLRLAVIASPTDLGSVSALWHQPEPYARFLDQELSLVFKGRLLVVMPNGVGMAGGGQPPASGPALTGNRSVAGPGLGRVAIDGVRQVAAASGHALSPVAVSATRSSGSTSAVPIVTLAVGLVLIAASWSASLRARPLRLRGAGS